MNVKTPLFPHPSKSKVSSSSASPTPAPIPSVDMSGPSQHYWTMPQYLAISLPLTAIVILLPLIAGPCFKFVSQKYAMQLRQWQALFVGLVASYFVGLIVVYAMGPSVIYYSVSYSVLGSICMVRVVRAYRRKQGRLRRSVQLLTMTICLVLDLGLRVLPWALVSFLVIFLTSKTGIRWLNRVWNWLSWKTRRQSTSRHSSIATV